MAELQCRFIEPVGWRAYIIALWDGETECLNGWKGHSGRVVVEEIRDITADPDCHGMLTQYESDPRWAMTCERCGVQAPAEVKRAASWKRFFDTPTGNPGPGDMFWVPCWPKVHTESCFDWDNCDGNHLHVILPNGTEWDVDSRASNCTLKKDRTHRCWVREGEPPNVHVSKGGHTCGAGSGSIAVTGWHGFLRHGKLVG